MRLPLHEQLSHENWRRMIDSAGPGDVEALRKLTHTILEWGIACRGLALQQARAMLPQQEAPTAEATGALLSPDGDQNSSS
ncbi:MAG: hypothetical protein VKK97_11500 [Synechococcaceae cyanobacterium]|nr:hypothetical protein [Synechococcaceae cyanobacterium]